MRIIHLSDLHLSKSNENDLDYLVDAINKDLKAENEATKIDLIAFTGDFIDKGGKEYTSLEEGFRISNKTFIQPILQNLGLSNEHFFMVLGNHDIIRSSDKPKFDEIVSSLDKTDKINGFIRNFRNDYNKDIASVQPFKDFEKEFYKGLSFKHKLSNFESSFILQVRDLTVGVSCINSSWLCYDDNDKGRLIIGENQLEESAKFIKDCNFKIALFHHPIDFLLEEDFRYIEPMLMKDYNLVLNGHVHSAKSSYSENEHGQSISGIGTNCKCCDIRKDTRDYSVGYQIIDIDFISKKAIIKFQRYRHVQRAFILYTDKGNNGLLELPFKLNAQLEEYALNNKIIKSIEDEKFPEINQHLISYGTETISPKSLDNLFVMPLIIDQPIYEPGQSKELNIIDFIFNDKNFLIFGRKEIGKSTFLDKAIIEVTKNFQTLGKIPVYINVNEMGNKEIAPIIRQYLGITLAETKQLIEKKKIILFVDDVSFSDKYKERLTKLYNSVKDDGLKIIAATNESFEELFSPESFEFPEFNFIPTFMKPFEGKQIRSLISNWFSGKKDSHFQERLELLINNLRSFALPRTPMSITIFLWLIEKQEYNPINKSTLLQRFIEGILERFRPSELFAKTFDFDNKVSLLGAIAELMLQNDYENHGIPYQDLLGFIQQYLKDLSIDTLFKSRELLDGFVDSTVFKSDMNDMVRFRFPVYFEFFLAKQMEKNPKLKEKILSRNEYEEFVNEIDYYTGLNRAEEQILKDLSDRLEEEFKEINDEIYKHNVDDFFEVSESLFENFDILQIPDKAEREKAIDKYVDKEIKSLPVNEDIPQKYSKKRKKSIANILALTAIILKNLEEVKNEELKFKTYSLIVRCSIAVCVLYKVSVLEYIKVKKKYPHFLPTGVDVRLLMNLFPAINQITLFSLMGSLKLSQIIERKIEEDKKSNVSEFEKYTSIFVFADIKSKDYFKVIKDFYKTIKYRYTLDNTFFKVLSYYYLRTFKKKEIEKAYENLLAELKIKSLKISRESKSKILKDLKKGKKIEEKKRDTKDDI